MNARGLLIPIVGCAAILLCLFAVASQSSVGQLLVGIAIGGGTTLGVVQRRRAVADLRVPLVTRLGGCGLSPGVGVHAVRFGDRVLLLGATAQSVQVLDVDPKPRESDSTMCADPIAAVDPVANRTNSPEQHEGWPTFQTQVRRRESRIQTLALALATSALLAGLSGTVAHARQTVDESTKQRVTFGEQNANAQRSAPAEAAEIQTPLAQIDDFKIPTRPETGTGALIWLAALAILPFVFMGTTSFVKISVVLSLLRNALGTPQAPSDPVLVTIALSLTLFVMAPVLREVSARVLSSGADLSTAEGAFTAATAGAEPMREFLKRNAGKSEVALFTDLAQKSSQAEVDQDGFSILIPAFVTTELREAFITGFLIFIPFLIVDLVIANILMSMGMMMVSPTTISLPFKIMLFVLIDGWPMVMKGLALSYS